MATTNAVGGVERRFRKKLGNGTRLEIAFAPGQEESRSVGYRDGALCAGFLWTLAEIESGNGYVETFDHLPAAQPEEESPPSTDVVECDTGPLPAVEGAYCCTTGPGECEAICCVGAIETQNSELDRAVERLSTLAQLALYRTFHAEALAAHAHASPSLVEIEFGRADDRLRAGLAKL